MKNIQSGPEAVRLLFPLPWERFRGFRRDLPSPLPSPQGEGAGLSAGGGSAFGGKIKNESLK